jgi:putative peptidoglycan lipid II flippase
MLKSSGAVAAATMTSRILGLVREMVYARFMGAGWVADAFTMAFMVPNLFRRLLGEGALTAAFIPVFKQQEKEAGDQQMWRSANAVVSGLVVILAGLVLVTIGGISLVLGVTELAGKTRLMLGLLRVMFPFVVLVCVAALFMGMLNARGHFFIPALGSALLNLVLIGFVLWVAPRVGVELHEQIFGLALGVLAAGLAQALFQWPLLHREGFRCRWVRPWQDPIVRHVIRQMIPGTIGVAAYQINVLLTNGIAFYVDDAIVASFNYAIRLMELPQGVFGLSLATYMLPTLAGLAVEKDLGGFRLTLHKGIGYLVFVNLLAAVLLFVLAEPIIRLLFEGGSFDSHDTDRTALALIWLAPGLVAYSTVTILARGFYALGDLRTPMRISIFCLGLNIVLVLTLVWRFREAGLGVANSITAVINAGLLTYALQRKIARLGWTEFRQSWPGLITAGLAAGTLAWVLKVGCDRQFGHGTLLARCGGVFIPMTGAAIGYVVVSALAKVPYALELLHFRFGKSRLGER